MNLTEFLLSCPRLLVDPRDSRSMLELERLDCNIGFEVISFRHSILLLGVTFNVMKTLDQPETCLATSVEEILVGVETAGAGSTGETSVLTVEIHRSFSV